MLVFIEMCPNCVTSIMDVDIVWSRKKANRRNIDQNISSVSNSDAVFAVTWVLLAEVNISTNVSPNERNK